MTPDEKAELKGDIQRANESDEDRAAACPVIGTCDTCKWWGETISLYQYASRGRSKRCIHITSDGNVPSGSSVSPIHDNDFLSDLFTSPKFGCVHHERK